MRDYKIAARDKIRDVTPPYSRITTSAMREKQRRMDGVAICFVVDGGKAIIADRHMCHGLERWQRFQLPCDAPDPAQSTRVAVRGALHSAALPAAPRQQQQRAQVRRAQN